MVSLRTLRENEYILQCDYVTECKANAVRMCQMRTTHSNRLELETTASEPTSMIAHDGYLPVSQEQDGLAAATPWRVSPKAQAFYFIAQNAGLLLVICAQFVFASMDLSVKLLETMDPPTPTLEVRFPANAITLR